MVNEIGRVLWLAALSDWSGADSLFDAKFLAAYGHREWGPLDEKDRSAAYSLHVELISRISTQPLAYNEGSEKAALESIYSLFGTARTLTQAAASAYTFEIVVWHVLNTHVRPFTAKWHAKAGAGSLRALDSSDIFREELLTLQGKLLALDSLLAKIAGVEWYEANHISRPIHEAIEKEMLDQTATPRQAVWKPMGEPSSVAVVRPRTEKYAAELDRLRLSEREHVKTRRKFYKVKDEEWSSGLALSGGGIRSATFAMGVLVSLSRRNLLPQFDYLSTVSGGGYTGSFLTQLLGSPDADPNLSLRASDLPFKREQGESLLLQRLRHGASFLSGGAWERFSVAMFQAQGIFINFLLLVLLISLLANAQIVVAKLVSQPIIMTFAYGCLIAFFLWAIILQVGRSILTASRQFLNELNPWVCGFLLLVPLWALTQAANGSATWIRETLVPDRSLFLGYAIVFLLMFGAAMSIGCALFIGFSRIRPALMSAFTIIFIVLGEGFFFQILNGGLDYGQILQIMVVIVVTGAFLFCTFSVNSTSLHHYYRTKLAKAFLLDARAEPAAPMKLTDFESQRAMFPIINCALNVPNSKMPEMRGRQADLFSFTPVSAGANLIEHSAMSAWEGVNGKQLDLATVMALSGAAVSPQMGLKTNRYGSFWLTLLNLRLSLWLKNPRSKARLRLFPNIWNLQKELFASADEDGGFLNISDGGHIENLGVYELLRRRCRFIVAVDGENDSQMTFHALTNLQRLAYIDHGVVIEANLDDLRKGEDGLSRSHFRVCRIRYPSGAGDRCEELGYLVYLKLSLTGNEGEFIRRYKFDEPAFPHHPTANQFFTEVQFEAYRALGEHVGDKMFLPAITGFSDGNDIDLEKWFLGLGKSFLDPLTTGKPEGHSKTSSTEG
ncbi:patatin-like phospholipase family protein [Agrobacterium rosae]|uniref:patatin-like phospholipase family protein n=1 Tax=Agrobacterium rosae TaxID=1972867 RepID=UPI003A801EA0